MPLLLVGEEPQSELQLILSNNNKSVNGRYSENRLIHPNAVDLRSVKQNDT